MYKFGTETDPDTKQNTCLPFFAMVWAFSILNLTEGHFKAVLAFERKWGTDYKEDSSLFFFIIRRLKNIDHLGWKWENSEANLSYRQTIKQAEDFICHGSAINSNTSHKSTKIKVLVLGCVCVCTLWLLWSNAQIAEAPIQRVSITLLSRQDSSTFMALSERNKDAQIVMGDSQLNKTWKWLFLDTC